MVSFISFEVWVKKKKVQVQGNTFGLHKCALINKSTTFVTVTPDCYFVNETSKWTLWLGYSYIAK